MPVAVDRAVLLPSELVPSNASGNVMPRSPSKNVDPEALKSDNVYDEKRHPSDLPPLEI